MTRPPDENELQQIRELLQSGRKDEATHLYRTITRAGIFETKDAIEELERQLPQQPLKQRQNSQSGFLLDDEPPFAARESDSRVFDELADIRLLARQGETNRAIELYRERKGVSLDAARRAVDALSGGASPASSDMPAEQQPEARTPVTAGDIDQCILRGQKVSAVKLYRELHGVDLKTAKDAVDARETVLRHSSDSPVELRQHPADTQPMVNTDPIDQCILRGEKSKAIRLYRERYRTSLKEAKDAINTREEILRASMPGAFPQPRLGGQGASGPGAGFVFLMVLLLLGLIYWYFSV